MTTTPQDLLTVALDVESGHLPEQGELSLALAGAELIDLLGARAVRLDDDRIVPGDRPTIADHLLDQAAAALVRQSPYESVDDWLWRRGRGLAAAYLAALEADSPVRREASDRRASHEPVLAALASAAGIDATRTGDSPDETDQTDVADDAVATVLAAVNDAVRELDAVRQRRAIEDAAFANIWRGGVL
ncbi:GPP34 family phosphoprotein [Kitasatospora sp. NBC_00374]|uniref:GPP34 family phosphoprotein n=1 Tax=Kitasatospora sp. NBC_00374 TaxID=2975964 RepID=UPI0030E417DD